MSTLSSRIDKAAEILQIKITKLKEGDKLQHKKSNSICEVENIENSEVKLSHLPQWLNLEDIKNNFVYLRYSSTNLTRKIEQILKTIGITDDELGIKILEAETTNFDMFFNNIDPISEIPIARLKIAWEILKGNDPFTKKEEKPVINNAVQQTKPIGQWSDLELLESYGYDCPLEIEEHLNKITKGRPAIIFDKEGRVDVEKSLYMVRKARHQETPSTFIIRQEMHKVYRVGEWPLEVFFECPIHSHILLMDGYCDECGMKWNVDDYEKNSFLRLISERESEVDIRLYKKMDMNELIENFPKTFLKFKDLKDEGKLPSLKRKLSKTHDTDPFRVIATHKTY